MKRDKKGYFKRLMGVMVLACMLLTIGTVNSNADNDYGIMPCGETAYQDNIESQ